ncbi:hypothetical protein IV203_010976 [Nitzschia inconspicua]|uniref:Uncharacterized protein n=1 Tax=Nitzschia inconspicua TaxID=303405 RepID=A0A9K3KYS6_9STRA|nr:hypothetical protein IV203_010976 [Nitzschia inconspicua]
MSFNHDCKLIVGDANLYPAAVKSFTVRELVVLQDTVSCCSDVSCDDLSKDDTCMLQSDSSRPTSDSETIQNLRWEASNHSRHSIDSTPMCYRHKRQRPAIADSSNRGNLRWEATNHSERSVDSVPKYYGHKRRQQRPAERSNTSKDLPFRAPIRYTEKERNYEASSSIVSLS